MATKVRLTATAYDQPAQWEGFKPREHTTTVRRMGDVFEVEDAELARLRDLEAVEDYNGDDDPDKDVLDMLSGQVKRMNEEHKTLSKREGVHPREVELSQARLDEAQRTLDRFKAGRSVNLEDQRGVNSPGPRVPGRRRRTAAPGSQVPAKAQAPQVPVVEPPADPPAASPQG